MATALGGRCVADLRAARLLSSALFLTLPYDFAVHSTRPRQLVAIFEELRHFVLKLEFFIFVRKVFAAGSRTKLLLVDGSLILVRLHVLRCRLRPVGRPDLLTRLVDLCRRHLYRLVVVSIRSERFTTRISLNYLTFRTHPVQDLRQLLFGCRVLYGT